MTEFDGVVTALGQALQKRGYTELTPVQKAVIAPELAGADALVSAQTGSGKTVAFGLALAPALLAGAERFGSAAKPLALIVAPTRELALQVKRELDWLYEMTGAASASCVGGMDFRDERRALAQGAHIVVGTPGRLRDHIERGSLDTTGLLAVVLDEADEMLDLGFRDDLEYILGSAPKQRRTLMFSATVPRAIASLAKRYQRDAVRVQTSAERAQHVDIEYRALTVAPNDRENAIMNVLRFFDAQNALVFCATRAAVNHMTSRFNNRGFSVVALSGELSQNERTHALQAMRDGRARVCIATDVAARGIDLPNLELVIHADVPKNGDSLVHRSGRTGRAGRKGVSVVIVPHNARKRTEQLFRSAGVDAAWARPPSADDIKGRDRERILDDPALSQPIGDDERVFVNELLARHQPERIAAAFLRLHGARQPAPEELLDTAPEPAAGKSRDDFTGGVWLSLSVGRKDSAEARWLLPLLCRAGRITKNEIGAIRIHQNETHVELTPGAIDGFLEAVGPSRKIEKTITVTRLSGVPEAPRESGRAPARAPARARPTGDKPYGKKPFGPNREIDYAKSGPKRKFTKKTTEAARDEKKPWAKSGDKPRDDKPWAKSGDKPQSKPWVKSAEKAADKPRGKPWEKGAEKHAERSAKSEAHGPHKQKFVKFGGKSKGKPQGSSKSGAAPLKRKPPAGGTLKLAPRGPKER